MCDFSIDEKLGFVLEMFPRAKNVLEAEIREFLSDPNPGVVTIRRGELVNGFTAANFIDKRGQSLVIQNGKNSLVCEKGVYTFTEEQRHFMRAFGVEIEQRQHFYVKRTINPIGTISAAIFARQVESGLSALTSFVITPAFCEGNHLITFEPNATVAMLIESIRNITQDPKVHELLNNYPNTSVTEDNIFPEIDNDI